ncbi:MAG: hypothetical protein J5685_02870 [Clostridiales bacterium]|nr:hypothetical protein [Clostridiales bacterium]
MSKIGRTVLIVVGFIIVCVLIFGGLMIYGAWDYTHRCVRVTAKEGIEEIEVGRTYDVKELFDTQREKEPATYYLSIAGDDAVVEISEDNHSFTVVEGSGTVHISFAVMNEDSPEGLSDSMDVTLVG